MLVPAFAVPAALTRAPSGESFARDGRGRHHGGFMRVATERRDFRLLGDQPYSQREDPFDFNALAADLKTLILASRNSTPFTIGIEASWGRGKSSLMAQVRDALCHGDTEGVEIRTVAYNAWTAEGQDVLEGLVKSVLQAMDKNALRRALRNRRLVGALKIPLFLIAGWLRVGGLVDKAWDAMSADARTRNQVNEVVKRAMDDWLRNVGEAGPNKLIVVFIDDLDRCSPENVLKVFEGLKLYLDARGFVFVIGYDEAVVTQAVTAEREYANRATGRDYVEKIVQIVFRIPAPTDDEIRALLDHFTTESRTQTLFEEEAARTLVIERNGRNPRRIKRFINRFILDYQLDQASQDLDAELLIKLLILETYFPEFARLLAIPAEKNPVQEFLDFASVREKLRSGTGDPLIGEVFTYYKTARPENANEALQLLEREAPETFVGLVRDSDFMSLVQSLEEHDDQELLVAKVQRRQELQSSTPPVEELSSASISAGSSTGGASLGDLRGRLILWIDDHPSNNSVLADSFRAAGARVELARDAIEAMKILAASPDLVISDVGRGGNSSAGFDDARTFRDSHLYGGPLIFYSGRISSAMREAVDELDAQIVSTPADLRRAVDDVLARGPVAA
jgi:CheY-like chemotaxis protein